MTPQMEIKATVTQIVKDAKSIADLVAKMSQEEKQKLKLSLLKPQA